MLVHNALALLCVCTSWVYADFPAPFTRDISSGTSGNDVNILQHLLKHESQLKTLNASGVCDTDTVNAIKLVQSKWGLSADGIAGSQTLTQVLAKLTDDGYVNDNRTAESLGYLYKIVVPVHRNRSIETQAYLEDKNGTVIFKFMARAHGWNTCDCAKPWPNFDNTNDGLTMFAGDGNTLTGLMEADLNSPEPDPKTYGPYPVNRAVRGLEGNAAWMTPQHRYGILVHTGAWPGWQPPMSMPNSEGCIHLWPESVKTISEMLQARGVLVRNNPFGSLPYPFRPQGLLSVYQL